MDKEQRGVARTKLATVRTKLSEASMWVGEGDSVRAFQAAEEAYMAAFDAKDYLDRIGAADRNAVYKARLAHRAPAGTFQVVMTMEPYPGMPSSQIGHTYQCDILEFTAPNDRRTHGEGVQCGCRCHDG